MRVIGGELGGRKLVAPDRPGIRPTTDKVREAVFNALGSLDALDGALVADLFAGTGAFGIEALSRGSVHCTFVERDRAALALLRTNIDSLGLTDRSDVVAADARRAAAGLDVDVVFADPPYDFDAWPQLFGQISASLVVAESAHPIADAGGWETTRSKRYGRTWVAFLRPVE